MSIITYGFEIRRMEDEMPGYNDMTRMFNALQIVTGQDLGGNEGFYNVNGKLYYGENIDQPVTSKHYKQAVPICGFTQGYIKEWCLEYCEEGRSWDELPD